MTKEVVHKIEADNPCIDYMGRIDFTNPKAPTLIYVGSQIHTCFTGTRIKIIIQNHHHYYKTVVGFVLDGNKPCKVAITKHEEDIILTLAEGLEDKKHDIIIYKTHDAAHYFDFKGIILDAGATLYAPEPKMQRRIECFGDSISAGSVIEANDYVGKEDPENDGEFCNSWYSYIMVTARRLKAQIHNTSQGGIALFNNTGYFCSPDTIGMAFAFDKLRYNPTLGQCTDWDFSNYTPHVVVIAIGQNDAHPDNYMSTNLEKREAWKARYKKLIKDLQLHYPKATFILTTTLLNHDASWDDAITEVQQELKDDKVLRFLYTRNGVGTPGHVRIVEAEEMAEELTVFINTLGEEIWQ